MATTTKVTTMTETITADDAKPAANAAAANVETQPAEEAKPAAPQNQDIDL